jgi:hypothetical protein
LVAGVVVAVSAFVAVGVAGMASADEADRRAPVVNNVPGITEPQPDMAMVAAS